MFIKNWQPMPVKNTKKIKMTCNHCGNDSEHAIHEAPYGVCIGVVFAKKPLLSLKKYYFVCPICNNGTKEISKEQVKAHKIC